MRKCRDKKNSAVARHSTALLSTCCGVGQRNKNYLSIVRDQQATPRYVKR
jgi:hypothetical protein